MLKALCVILLITVVSMVCRWLAFKRMDSVALDISLASFLYNLMYSIFISDSLDYFLHHELMRCIVILMFTIIIGAVHRYYFEINQARIKAKIDKARLALELQYKDVIEEDEDERLIFENEMKIIDQVQKLAERSISVLYSQYIDAFAFDKTFFKKFLKDKKTKGTKGFRPNKTAVREGLAEILNTLEIEGIEKFKGEDFNIEIKSQAVGMILFDLMEVLSVIVAIRVI